MVSSLAYERSLAQRVSLNRAILKNKYWFLPVDNKGHEFFTPVGRGVKSSEFCAKWLSLVVCKNVEEGHKGIVINGVDCTGKVIVKHKHMWCHRPTCPVCFIRGWSVRGARSISGRLDVGVERGLGKVEHVLVSVHPDDYDLPEKVFRKKARLALKVRGVDGGVMIMHGFRIDRLRGCLVWSPHYHSMSFIEGGFDRCRDCVHVREDCASCSGFKGREVREYKKDKYVVKVFDERKTIFGSAFYQLNHATVRVSAFSRFMSFTWFGSCGNRKFAGVKAKSEDVCPACGEGMEKSVYVGNRFIAKNIGDVKYKAWFTDDEFDEDGKPNYVSVNDMHAYSREYG